MSRRARFLLRLLIAGGLVGLILRKVGLPAEYPIDARLILGLVSVAVLQILGQSLAALRWRVVLGPGAPAWSYLARLYLIGGFFSLFLPTAVGGDAVRAVAAASATGRPGGAAASVLLDRGFGVVALAIYAGLGLLLGPEIASRLARSWSLSLPGWAGWLGLLILILALLALWLIRRSARFSGLLQEAWAAILELRQRPRDLLAALGIALVVQGLYLLLWLVLAIAIRLPVSPVTLLLTVPVVTAASMLPITLSGLGVREGAWLVLLGGAGVPEPQIVAFSLLYFAGIVLAGLAGGLLFLAKGLKPVAASATVP